MSQNLGLSSTTAPAIEQDTAAALLNNLDKLRLIICKLQETNTDLERVRDECLVCYQQYSYDLESLKEIRRRLKAEVEKKETNTQNPVIQSIPPPPPVITSPVVQPPAPIIKSEPIPVPSIQDPYFLQKDTPLSMTDVNWTCEPPQYQNKEIKLKYCRKSPNVLCTVEFNSDGSLFAFADENDIFIMNTSDGSLLKTAPIPAADSNKSREKNTRTLTFSPDSKYIAIGGHEHDVVIYQVQNPRAQVHALKCHTNYISSLAFTKDSKTLYSAGFDGVVCKWNMETFKLVKKFGHKVTGKDDASYIVGLALAHDQSFLAIGYMDGTIGIFDPDLNDIRTFKVNCKLLGLALSNDDNFLATASQDHTSQIWSLNGVTPKFLRVLQGHDELIVSVCFSPDGKLLFSGSKDEKLKAWNTETGDCVFTINANTNTLFQVDHHPTENCFVFCSGDGSVCVWEYSSSLKE